MKGIINFPPQQIPESQKNDEWKKKCVDWADGRSYNHYSPVRNSILHKKINADLVNGILRMSDLKLILEPDSLQGAKLPKKIQHYPVMNGKIDLLIGEECTRVFDHRIIVTNPTAISEMEKEKNEAIRQRFMEFLNGDPNNTESQDDEELDKMNEYFLYSYQDKREKAVNFIVNHYWKELNIPSIFTEGFRDVITHGEEIYYVSIISGEPYIEHLDPMKCHVFRNGFSNRIEDADIVVLEDYWAPGIIIDKYKDSLKVEDIKYISEICEDTDGEGTYTDAMGKVDERVSMINPEFVGEDGTAIQSLEDNIVQIFGNTGYASLEPYDMEGNIRVLRVFWKSRRKIKKVRQFNVDTGEVEYNFYPESYEVNKNLGETCEELWINEAWEGTKIGEKVYVDIRPMPVQFNSISNPSKCHFGIIGQIYNTGVGKPYSIVDKMKPFQYLYDVMHNRLNELIATSWGTMIKLDMSKKPDSMSVEKWMYLARKSKVIVEDPFNEGREGAATGKLAGAMNTASNGVVNAEQTQGINNIVSLLQFLTEEMASAAGVSRQREGSIENRETVGGVERATMQSAMITKWLFSTHDDVKRRVIMAFIDVSKYCIRGQKKKWKNILDDGSIAVLEIDGDEYAECDYGMIVENGDGAQKLNNNIEMIAQAAMQNQTLDMSTIMKLFSTSSLSEKQKMVEYAEKKMQQRQQQAQQAEQEAAQQAQQAAMEQLKAQQDFQNMINERDNATKIEVAKINAGASIRSSEISAEAREEGDDGDTVETDNGKQIALDVAKMRQDDRHHSEDLAEQKREFDAKQNLDKRKMTTDAELKRKQIAKQAAKPKATNK